MDVTVGENTISIRPKMDLGTKNRCMDALTAIGRENGETEMAVHLGAYQVALMQENIVAWRGPAFVGMACTPAQYRQTGPRRAVGGSGPGGDCRPQPAHETR